MTAADVLAHALAANFTSPNVSDANFEAANVVDALDRLATAGFAIARALEHVAVAHGYTSQDGGP